MWFTKRRRAQTENDFETWIEGGVCPTLNAFDNTGDSRATVVIVFDNSYRDGIRIQKENTVNTLSAKMGTGGNNVPFVAQEEVIVIDRSSFNQGYDFDRDPGIELTTTSPTLVARGPHAVAQEQPVAIPIQDGREMEKKQNGLGIGQEGDPSYTLDQTGAQAVAYSIREDAHANNFSATEIQTARALQSLWPSVQSHHAQTFIAEATMQVRRLTPTECERLMGWPDNHTIPRADGKTNSDTTRYKMCGNGVASPVAQWIGEALMSIHNGEA